MRGRVIAGMVVVAFTVFAILAVLSGRTVAQSPFGDANAEPAPFNPQMAALMSMLIQPRHTKLWLAAQQKNWQLAGFELNEMGGALKRVGQTVPKYRNISVDATVSSIFAPKIQAVAGAITAQNPAQFNTAFAELTNACNLCHEALEHPFLVIKVPDASAAAAFPDQDFRPAAGAK